MRIVRGLIRQMRPRRNPVRGLSFVGMTVRAAGLAGVVSVIGAYLIVSDWVFDHLTRK